LTENGIFLLQKNSHSKLPQHLTLLLYAANRGDEAAVNAVIKEFTPTIKAIALEVQKEFELNDVKLNERLLEEGVRTLRLFMNRHCEEGFCNFIVTAIRFNITAQLFNLL
jgi:hypothetical protein